jgi:hypothetical protein
MSKRLLHLFRCRDLRGSESFLLSLLRRQPLRCNPVALTLYCDTDIAKPNRQPVAIGRFPSFANSHNNPPPIGVFTSNGGFHEWGIGNRKGNTLCRLVALCAFN